MKIITKILTAAPLSLLLLAEFYIITILTTVISSFLLRGISYIPVLKSIIQWLVSISNNYLAFIALIFPMIIAYCLILLTVERFKETTQIASLMILGIALIVLNIFYIILDMQFVSRTTDILIMITGAIFIFKAIKDAIDYKNEQTKDYTDE